MTYIPNNIAISIKTGRFSSMGKSGGGSVPPVVLPLGFGTGGLFLATVSTIPNKKAITIKKAFTIVFILVLKKQCEILLYNSQVVNRCYKVADLSMKNH